jgi:hypothetical protein
VNDKTLSDIVDERVRQDRKWGDQSGFPDSVWAVILTEEVGEACKAVLGPTGQGTFGSDDLHEELVQIAAVTIAWLEAIERRRVPDPGAHAHLEGTACYYCGDPPFDGSWEAPADEGRYR